MIPAEAELTARPAEIPAWDDMPEDAQAGAGPPDGGLRRVPGAHRPPPRPAHRRPGRPGDPGRHPGLLHHRRQRGLGRGHHQRHLQRADQPQRRRALETAEFMASRIDKFGTPEAYNHYAVGWAHAMDTPYQWTKQVASHWGGTRNGTIVHWPNGIQAKGEVRSQFCHVIDVAADRAGGGRAARADAWSTACSRAPAGRQHGLRLRRRRRGRPARDPVLRGVLQPGHLPPGLDRGDPPQHPLGLRGATAGLRR